MHDDIHSGHLPLRARPVTFFMFLLFTFISHTLAFDKDGHDAIGMIATDGLDFINNRANFELKKLLLKGDAGDAAYWTHEVEAKISALGSLHFQGQSHHGTCTADHCPEGRCLNRAIKFLYSQLVGDDTSQYAGVFPPDLQLTDSDAIKFIITLIGDMHQPMHESHVNEDFGRNSFVVFLGKTTNMFAVWETGLTALETAGSSWWSGWTQIANARTFASDRQAFQEKGLAVIDDWIQENANFACENIFTHMGQAIDPNLAMTWRRDLRSRLLMAGSRVAVIVHAILSERTKRGRAVFRGGSAFAPLPETDLLEASVTTQSGAAMVNLGVLGTVLLAFVLFVRHLNRNSHLKD